jgi:hypothetical protein
LAVIRRQGYGLFAATLCLKSQILAHRVAAHFDATSIMNQPVEDTIGQRRIADPFVPA